MNNLKRLLFLLLLGLSVSRLNAQKINYFQGTLEEAKAKAKKQHQLIYLMVEMGTNESPFSPMPLDKELIQKYEKNFICIYKSAAPKAGLDGIYQQYNITQYPTHLFLDQDASLILKTVGYRSRKEPYLADIAKATQLAKGKTLTFYSMEYQKGKREMGFLKDYLLKFEELEIPVNQDVLETYANLLPVNKLDDYETISFLIQRGPVLSSMAYKITRVYPKLTDSVYKKLPYEQRVKINNKMINASMALAKLKKDESLALQTAAFTQSSWSNNWSKGVSANSSRMMEYYKAVNDTTKYLRYASSYYQQYYLQLRDSIHKQETPPTRVTMSAPRPLNTTPASSSFIVKGKTIAKSDSAMSLRSTTVVRRMETLSSVFPSYPGANEYGRAIAYATTLNNGAWNIYSMRTSNADYLSKAVIWVWRSIELYPENPAFYDTLAHLYYLQKKYDDAINTQQKAINISRTEAAKQDEMMLKPGVKPPASLLEARSKTIAMYSAELEKMQRKSL